MNGVGKLTGTTFPAGSKALKYDNFGNVTETDFSIAGQSFVMKEIHDVQGRIREVDYPAVGGSILRVGYGFDPAGNLLQVSNLDTGAVYANNLAYNELNQIHAMTYGNGVNTRMDYDVGQGSYRLTDILTYSGASIADTVPVSQACTQAGTGAIQCLAYQYNKTSDILQISDYTNGGVLREFGYDDLHQLTSATGPWGAQSWTYDEIGSITSKGLARASNTGMKWLDAWMDSAKAKVPGLATFQAYTYDPARAQILTGVGTDTYQFDIFGNLARRNADAFTFDAQNHLADFQSATKSEGYFYDENGERVEKRNLKETVLFASKYFEQRGPNAYRHICGPHKRGDSPGRVLYLYLIGHHVTLIPRWVIIYFSITIRLFN